jgi:hypothetical protein
MESNLLSYHPKNSFIVLMERAQKAGRTTDVAEISKVRAKRDDLRRQLKMATFPKSRCLHPRCNSALKTH